MSPHPRSASQPHTLLALLMAGVFAGSPGLSARGQSVAPPTAQAGSAEGTLPKATSAPHDSVDVPLPPPRTHYLGREIAATMHFEGAPWLVRESRQREEDCNTMLRELRLQPGMTVCDMGCGNGFYTLPMAEQVGPSGQVLAVDIQPEMLRLLEERADQSQLTNVKLLLGTPMDPALPEGKVDLILCVDVYHEFAYPEQMLAAMRRALSPQGQLVLVEFREEDRRVPIKPLHKMSKRQILKELKPNGFRLARQFDELPWQHMMFFERDDAKAQAP